MKLFGNNGGFSNYRITFYIEDNIVKYIRKNSTFDTDVQSIESNYPIIGFDGKFAFGSESNIYWKAKLVLAHDHRIISSTYYKNRSWFMVSYTDHTVSSYRLRLQIQLMCIVI